MLVVPDHMVVPALEARREEGDVVAYRGFGRDIGFFPEVHFGLDALGPELRLADGVQAGTVDGAAAIQFPESQCLAAKPLPAAQVARVAPLGLEVHLMQQPLGLERTLCDNLAARGGGYGPFVFLPGNQVGHVLAGRTGVQTVIPAPASFLDMQIQGSGGGVGSPGDRVRGRDVRFAGTAAGIADDLRLLVFNAFIGHFFQILLDILVRHEDGCRVLRR